MLSALAQEAQQDRDQGEDDVYQHPELAGKAVQHGIALAKRIGAKATVLTVLPPFHVFTTDTQMIEDTPAQYKARLQRHEEEKALRDSGATAKSFSSGVILGASRWGSLRR
jgi:nucleotide-binding universal stress UspA family protein